MLKFKNNRDKELFLCLHPILIMIYSDLFWYTKNKYGIDLVVTSTISTMEEDKKLGRTSDSHRTCRALDIRTKDIDVFIVDNIVHYINNKWQYKPFHYTSKSGASRLAYLHTGTAEHIHLSIGAKFKLSQYASTLQ